MSELSFKTFCIEFYSKHIQKPEPEVYELFRPSGLLDMLETDYEDFHGMGMEALMQFYTGNQLFTFSACSLWNRMAI